MGKEYLIDSNVVIDFCNGKLPPKGRDLLFNINLPVISIITQIEVLGFANIEQNEEEKIIDFVSFAHIIPLDLSVSLKTIELRRNFTIKLPDAIIAATTLLSHRILLTRNLNDFKNIHGLDLLNPWEI